MGRRTGQGILCGEHFGGEGMKLHFDEQTESNLRKIAEYIKKNYPNSCIAYNDRDNHTSGCELVQEIADFFSYEIIKICGCGSPEDTIICIRDYLQILSDKFANKDVEMEKWHQICADSRKRMLEKFNAEYVTDNPLLQFMAYMLDDKGLTEHGSSVDGSWITDLGKMCLYVYNLLVLDGEEKTSEKERD